MRGPLSGVRILEIGHMLAGPYCGLLLADLGAEVIKIEPPEGDIARRVSPHFIGPHNDYFASLNRNKKSVILDLASDDGRSRFQELVRTAQALVTNLRPSAIKKLGLTYDKLQHTNPDIVCAALTGFGLSSPLADRPAYDYIVQAMTGVMLITGEPDGPPVKTGYSAVDNSAGMMAAFALTAKLVEKKGGQIDIAMYDVMLSQLNYIASAWLNAEVKAARYAGSAHPYMVPAQIFRAKDGWLALFITHDDFWRRFATEAGQSAWLTDDRFAAMEARRANRELVIRAIAEVIAGDTAESWVRRLVPLGVVAASVTSLETALASEQTAARNMVVTIPTQWAPIRAVGNPIKTGGAAEDYAPPPLLGEHNAELLGESKL
ncbi:MAG TPA: CoA transferase [Hyphomicrobiales bacterium]|nr:CoA transferase [Hyphomicrobiales bacterium]